jgi:hypothetical protein
MLPDTNFNQASLQTQRRGPCLEKIRGFILRVEYYTQSRPLQFVLHWGREVHAWMEGSMSSSREDSTIFQHISAG